VIVKSLAAGSLVPLVRPALSLARDITSLVQRTVKGEAGTDMGRCVGRNLGVDEDGCSLVYCARNDTPERNMKKILEMLGGIEELFDPEDIVILKPNAQWWGQGMTNTDAMKAFIEAVLSRPHFKGEVIIAENHQYDNPNSRGWTTEIRNGRFNLNELVQYFQEKGHANVTKYHWRPVTPQPTLGPKPKEWFSEIVEGPWEGEGYVYDKDLVYVSPMGRKCILSYPVFKSAFSGTVIDFKNGAWREGNYTGQQVKFINFSAINHHSSYAGVTASVKNHMGIVDMSCGHPRGGPRGYYNLHFLGVRSLPSVYSQYVPWRIKQKISPFLSEQYEYKYFYHTGAALGSFMKQVRMADLHFITAHWVGFGSRTDTGLSGRPKALLASTDPVALDYIAAKYVLLPLTKTNPLGEKFVRYNDPDNPNGPYRRFLNACNSEGVGTMAKEKMKVIS